VTTPQRDEIEVRGLVQLGEVLVAALPVELRELAHRLHQRVLEDDRTWLEVTAAAATAEGVALEDVLGGDRRHGPAGARRAAWAEIRERTCASYPEIGRAFGGVRHTTVLMAVRKHAELVVASAAAVAAVPRSAMMGHA
jgi:chromosomal replication initiation ATPase DnaA